MASLATPTGAAELTLYIADVVAPTFLARGIALRLPMDGSADMQVATLKVQQREFRNVHLHCGEFTLSSAAMACHAAKLEALPDAQLDFSYDFNSQQVQFTLRGTGGESWQVVGKLGDTAWQISAQLQQAQAKRLAAWLPAEMPLPNQGTLDGSLMLNGAAAGLEGIHTELRLSEIGFSDTSGLHAAEKLRGTIKLVATRKASMWQWQSNLAWKAGEMFWQPLYLKGGHTLEATGSFDGAVINVSRASAGLPEVGTVQFSGVWNSTTSQLRTASLQGKLLALDKLFADYAQPFLDKGVLAASSLSGQADVDWQYRDSATRALKLTLHEAGIADAEKRFALRGINTHVDWQADAPRVATVAFSGGALLGAPLGAGQWTVRMQELQFDVAQAELPILDGKLNLRDFHLHHEADKWHWQFAAALSPISMEQLSVAAGWPKMLGTLAGRIPKVTSDGEQIVVDGALLFNVFDGTVVASKLKLADAFGHAPRLSGNLNMRDLDLDLLTRTFSFGNMQGRIDVDVNDLQLQDWQPVRFDARVASSAGNYPKKISQKAVQNISALGGAGAAAAIQRSYLRFFEDFGYDRIGWSCTLRRGVCAMGGVDDSKGMTYAIVKGGGIPAISVMGYNQSVSWRELTTRLKRVMQDNVKPIVH